MGCCSTARVREGDLVVEDGRVVDVGTGLDGDDEVDCTGRPLTPGSWTATCTRCSRASTRSSRSSTPVLATRSTRPHGTSAPPSPPASPPSATPAARTPAAQGGPGRASSPARGCRSRSRSEQTGGHGGRLDALRARVQFLVPHPGLPVQRVDGVDRASEGPRDPARRRRRAKVAHHRRRALGRRRPAALPVLPRRARRAWSARRRPSTSR